MDFLAGAAQRGSEIMQEERENTQKLVDSSMKFWTETGIEKYNERKGKRKDLSMKFERLDEAGFTPDQIDVAARQNKVDDILKYVDVQRDRKLAVNPSEIIRLSGDYKETGRTMDEVLEGVMGKVNRGMTMSDAIEDMGGQKRGFLGQNLGKIAQKRSEAFAGAFGMSADELRALATDDIDIDASPVSGNIFLTDEVAAAQAQEIIQGKGLTAGQERLLGNDAANAFGVSAKVDGYGNFTGFGGDNPDAIAAASRATLEATIYYDDIMKNGYQDKEGNTIKPTANQARLKTQEFILQKSDEFKKLPPEDRGVVGGSGASTSSTTSGMPNYSGIGLNELPNRIAQSLSGIDDDEELAVYFRQAENELYKRYREEQGMSAPDARAAAEEEMKRIRESLLSTQRGRTGR